MIERERRLEGLAPSSHSRWTVPPRAIAIVLLAVVLAACGPPIEPDAGLDGGERDASAATGARVSIPREPIELGDVTFESFTVHVGSVRLVSDRGPTFDPVRTAVGPLDLVEANDVSFDEVPPASYSAVVLVLDGAASQLTIEAEDARLGEVRIRYASRLEWMARCSAGIPVRVGESLAVAIDLELETAWEELRDAPLPEPVDGVIVIDEDSAPEVLADFVERLGESIVAECDRE